MNRTTSFSKISFYVFFASLLIGGVLSVYFGKELQWDLAGYHYYNPFAFLNHRWDIDYWPASNIQLYYSPTMDFLSYFLINTFSPFTTEFILGAIHGINIWLMFYLSYRFLAKYNPSYAIPLSIVFAAIGMYGPISFSEIGSFMNDNLISIFVILSILLQIIFLQNFTESAKTQLNNSFYFLFSGGFVLGLALGLKLTAGIFVIGTLVSFCLLPIKMKTKVKILFLWSLGFTIGFLLLSGYWMYFLWQRFHSPFFPLFNQIFQAPGFPTMNWHDLRFMPKNFLQTLFYPFYFSWNGQASDLPLIDYRLSILYILMVISGVLWVRKKREGIVEKRDLPREWILLFALFTYIAWQIYFSHLRYLVALQIISPLLIYLLVRNLLSNIVLRVTLLSFIFLFIITNMVPMKQERMKTFGNNYFNVQIPASLNKIESATVLMAYSYLSETIMPFPQTYLIPFFPRDWRFIGVPFHNINQYVLPEKIKELVLKQSGNIYLLSSSESMKAFYKAANELGLKKTGDCETIISDRHRKGVLICPVAKN